MNLDQLPSYNHIRKAAKQKLDSKPLKIALLGDSALQFLHVALKGCLQLKGINPQIFEGDIGQVQQQLLTPESDLALFQPQFIIVFEGFPALQKRFFGCADPKLFYQREMQRVTDYALAAQRIGGHLIYLNHWEQLDLVFGHFGLQEPNSFSYQVKKLNVCLMDVAEQNSSLSLLDFNALCSAVGSEAVTNRNLAVQTDSQIALDFLPLVAQHLTRMIEVRMGLLKKCLVLDLDNTLWGGIIGDDGLEKIQIGGLGIGKVFSDIQRWARQLKKRGVILAVASKNTESVAQEPFIKHPDMILKLDDFAVFKANWNNKVQSIQEIQETLNIGLDSFVFLDDNPFERAMVKENLPAVTVPDLPEDPTEYLPYLQSLNLFETAQYSSTDAQRTQQYQQEAKRLALKDLYENESAFLKSLNMQARVEGLTAFNTPRVAQLSQRSNQFNLRTMRFNEAELTEWVKVSGQNLWAFYLQDQFGDHGLVALIMTIKQGENWFITNWIMSCRVLKRSLENFCLNQLVEQAQKEEISGIIGSYVPTAKNDLVKNHYQNLGFTSQGDEWHLKTQNYEPKPNYIELKNDEN